MQNGDKVSVGNNFYQGPRREGQTETALMLCKLNNQINSQLIKEGLMIRSSVPEEPTGETDCSTYVLSQDNK